MALYSNVVKIVRQRIARLVDDLILATVSSGSTSTAVLATTDPPLFLEQDNDYFNLQKYEVYCYEGTNIGQAVLASAWVKADHTLTIKPTQTSAYGTSSKLELHRIFAASEYLNAINLAIALYARKYLLDTKDETTITLVQGLTNDGDDIYTYEYNLPLNILYLQRVITEGYKTGKKLTGTISGAFTLGEKVTGGTSGATGILSYGPSGGTYILVREVVGTFAVGETATGGTSTKTCSSITAIADAEVGDGKFEIGDTINSRDYTITKSYPPKIKLNEDYYTVIGDLRLRLEGQGSQAEVSADTDNIFLPPDEFCEIAVTYLPFSKIESNNLLNTFQQCLRTRERILARPVIFPYANSKRIIE